MPSSPLPATALRPGGRAAAWAPEAPTAWVLLDVDGTLIGPSNAVAEEVVEAVAAVVDAGIRVGYATGRNVAGVRAVHDRLRLAGPHVVLNGAQVREGGRALHTWALSPEQVRAVLARCAEAGLYAELYLDDAFLVTSLDERYRPHWDRVIGEPAGVVTDDVVDAGEVIKMTIVTLDDRDPAPVVEDLRGLGLSVGTATSPATPGMTFLNTTRSDVDKGAAIRVAAEAIGVSLGQVVVIGDGANDLPMLAVAGTAIAMGDAGEAVRAAAHLVTDDVEAHGAAVALRDVLARHEGR